MQLRWSERVLLFVPVVMLGLLLPWAAMGANRLTGPGFESIQDWVWGDNASGRHGAWSYSFDANGGTVPACRDDWYAARKPVNYGTRSWFCAAVFAEANADAMVEIYEIRERYHHPERYTCFLPISDCGPDVIGTPEYSAQLRLALALGDPMVASFARTPTVYTPMSPSNTLDAIVPQRHVPSISSEAFERISAAKAAGAGQAQLQQILNETLVLTGPYKREWDWKGGVGTTGLYDKLLNAVAG